MTISVLGQRINPNDNGQYYGHLFDGLVTVHVFAYGGLTDKRWQCVIRIASGCFYGDDQVQSNAIVAAEEKLASLCKLVVKLGFL